ncbi:MAG TPA: ATP-binding protein, partial [Anaeromyxobacteraceae bacterium]|nr:ATP-binding protein [Anaeromyxobacteraceae bacterium]
SNRTLAATQQSLVRAEKLATVGTLVAGLGHEMNGPLACLKSGAASATHSLGELGQALDRLAAAVPAELRQPLEGACRAPLSEALAILAEIAANAGRLHGMVQDLRTFALSEPAPAEEVDLEAEVRRAWQAVGATTGARFAVGSGGEALVRSARHLVAEVLAAVLRNAGEAAGREGEVRVTLRPTRSGVLVSVQDSGPGIRPEHLPRVFDPFFTTKPVGTGRGMGLAMAYGIMRSLGGRIEAASEPGAGATFRVWLPRRPPGGDGHELSPPASI